MLSRIIAYWVLQLLLVGAVVGCGDVGAGNTNDVDAGDAATDVTVLDDAVSDSGYYDAEASVALDAESDSEVDAEPNPFVFELPPSGQNAMLSFTISENVVTYSEDRVPGKAEDVYYFDITTKTEHQVTDRIESQMAPYVHAGEIVFMDSQFFNEPTQNYQVEIYHYDIAGAAETRLTNSTSVKIFPAFNDDYLLYFSSEGCPAYTDSNLSLMDRQTEDVTVLADCDQDPESASISDQYAAWSARPFPGHNKDIFYRDLLAGITYRIDSTDAGSQYFAHAEGDHIVWQDHRSGTREVYLYTISTGVEECLTPDQWEQVLPHLRNGIVSWCDHRFSQQTGYMTDCDMYVYELATGVGRRVTTQSGPWLPSFVDSGWILYALWIFDWNAKLYVHDLVGDGILTSDGHVIP